ncbi:HesA/MoeB/ThiF family protein [Puniceibacterium sp. IMCC21224]|uniref:HesA/MoeB/ThiF family protein n=1 Tax=Puniceibacterium sp. IMCC21224 TaxID=1618204 RepID=UPI00065CE3EC|nr:HesA/MoeB/ThiF family protein [Puniceibacterium sp. IMCC21224]KMK66196.1 dinucleotide-utilizing enzyme [Puniceibacterium sp. IMCC21224]
MNRYTRQQILPDVGVDGQARLTAAHLLVVGAGGLGCPALMYLAGAGVGRITIVDPDVVSRSNLHRQVLYTEGDVDHPKADRAATHLSARNSDIAIVPICASLTPATVGGFLDGVDAVLDCADSFAVSYVLSDACHARELPLFSASALGFAGYAGGFCGGAPSLRAVFPDLPAQAASCDTAGVMGPLVGTLGAMQAQMALSYLLALKPAPLGQMLTLDLRTFRSAGFRFDGAPEPERILSFVAPDSVTSDDFAVELRGEDEAPLPFVPHAARHVATDFGPGGPLPKPDQRTVLCCRSGLRAWTAARLLQARWPGEISLISMGDAPALTVKGSE